ncbi:MAG: hypothetical protein ACTHMQ_08710 [Protaetiibacter sp.]
MRTRRIIAVALAVLALPLLVLGLIDPLEGGVALLVAIAIGVVVWALSRVRLPALLWISLLATVAIGALTIGLAVVESPPGTMGGTARNPVFPLIALVWVWRAGVLVVAAGAVLYIVRLFRALQTPGLSRRADGT